MLAILKRVQCPLIGLAISADAYRYRYREYARSVIQTCNQQLNKGLITVIC